ncbi:MAG: Lrp/AsnC ligand binding domain-containing protein [Nitrososphaerales archaeon]
MPSAYVLINCDFGSEESITKQIAQLAGVKEVKRVYGAYDIIVRVETGSTQELKEALTWKIRRIPQVRSTLTLLLTEKGQG